MSFSKALLFDGINDYLTIPNTALLSTTSTITIEARIKALPTGGYQKILGKGSDASEMFGFYLSPSGSLRIEHQINNVQSAFDSGIVLTDDNWHHVAYTYDGVTERFFIDGIQRASQAKTGSLTGNSEQISIGREVSSTTSQSAFKGAIDEVRIWNTLRSPSQIQANINNSLTGNEAGLVAYLKLDEGSGVTASDSTINGNNGSLGGGVVANQPIWVSFAPTSVTPNQPYTAYRNAVLADNPIAYWQLDETTGNTITDASGNQKTGNFVSGITLGTSGEFQTAASFDGVNSYIDIPLNSPETNYTFELWFKTSKSTGGISSVRQGTNYADDRDLYLKDGNLYNRIYSEQVINTTGKNYADNQWHYVAVVLEAGIGQKLYVDGVLEASGNKGQSDFNYDTYLTLGRSYETNGRGFSLPQFQGSLDEVALYNTPLSASQIRNHFSASLTQPSSNVDLAVSSSSVPTVVTWGSNNVSWTVTNIGTIAISGNWSDRIYLSDDAILDSKDLALATFAAPVTTLAANGSYTQTKSISLPSSVDPNQPHYLLFVTDDNGRQIETNKSNNIKASALLNLSIPDLVYFSNFEGNIGSEWTTTLATDSSTVSATPVTDNTEPNFTKFLGRFGGNRTTAGNATLSLSTIVGQTYRMEFDLFTINSWDGNNESDRFKVQINGSTAFNESFTNFPNSYTQSFRSPDQSGDLGFRLNNWPDSIYRRIPIIFTATTTNTQIKFLSDTNSLSTNPISTDESWGIDNVNVWKANAASGQPDLIVTAIAPPLATNLNGTVALTWTVKNQGTAIALNNWLDKVYLSKTNVVDSTAIALGTGSAANFTPLAAGDSYTLTQTFNLPTNVVGDWNVLVAADGLNLQAESNENNNVFASATPLHIKAPDLVISAATNPVTAPERSSISVTYTVTNQGDADTTSSWYDYVYLSDKTVLDSSARYISYFNTSRSAIAAGGTYTQTSDIFLPAQIGSGRYYLLFSTDNDRNQVEANETNNVRAVAIDITLPDLVPTIANAPVSVVVGSSANFSWTVQNQGNVAATHAWTDRVYISDKQFLDNTATAVGSSNSGANNTVVAANGSYTVTSDFVIPDTTLGNRYLLFAIDDGNNRYETNESNNVIAIPVQVTAPDLIVSAATAPSSASLGDAITLNWTVKNQGSVTAAANWYDYFYISTKPTFDNSARYLFYKQRDSALVAGASYSSTQTFTLPTDITAGQNYLFAVADNDRNQGETDETNNVKAIPITINAADLIVTTATADITTVAPGATLNLSYTVKNQGAVATNGRYGGWYDRIYLSTTPNLTGVIGATELSSNFTSSSPNLGVNGTYTKNNISITLPNNLNGQAGDRYLLFVTDANNYQVESNEANNIYALPLTITGANPDLVVSSASIPNSTVNVQQTFTATYTTTNQGTAATNASYWYDRIYISSDAILDSTDTVVSDYSYINNPLAINGSYTANRSIAIPTDRLGNQYLLFATNNYPFAHQTELTETNNVKAIPIQVVAPDLQVGATFAPSQAFAGARLEVQWTVINQGTGSTVNSWYDSVYLSDTPIFDLAKSTLLKDIQTSFSPLSNGQTYTGTAMITLPSNVTKGSKYLVFVTDRGAQQGESDETNNIKVIPISVVDPDPNLPLIVARTLVQNQNVPVAATIAPDLVVTAFTAPVDAPERSNLALTWTVKNQASVATSGSWYDRVYLSDKTIFDSSAQFMGQVQYTGAALAINDSYTLSANFALPERTGLGRQYLLVVSDIYGNVTEASEVNNVFATPINITLPDLTVTAATNPITAAIAQSIPVSWTVKNQGAVVAAADWTDSIYVSDQQFLDNTATLVKDFGHSRNNTVNAGTSYDQTNQNVIIPITKLGDRYLLYVTDSGKNQGETNETNNVIARPITITAPDLVVSGGSIPTSTALNSTIPISWTVTNQGTVDANATWYDRIYISSKPTFDGSAIYINQFQTNPTQTPLLAGSSYTFTNQNINIPVNAPVGSQYLLVYSDIYNTQGETNETNNVKAFPIFINAADLTVTSASSSLTTAAPGATLNLSYTVKNQGQSATTLRYGLWYDRIYLSDTQTLSGATLLNTAQRNLNLAINDTYTKSNISVTLPTGAAIAGNKYLLFVTDTDNYETESNENNNIYALPLTITGANPDLVVTSASVPSIVAQQQTVNVSAVITNQGTAPTAANYLYTFAYISDNSTFSADDTQLNYSYATNGNETPLAVNASYSTSFNITIPQGRTGSQYILFVTDKYNYQSELDKTNNLLAVPITVKAPDLIVSAATAPVRSYAGARIAVSSTVKNQGDVTASSSWTDSIYLSTKNVLDGSEIKLKDTGTSSFSPLNPNTSYSLDQFINIPNATATGSYNLIFVADSNGAQGETDETNNTRVVPILIGDTQPDLTLTTALASATTAALGQTINVNWAVKNIGTLAANSNWYDAVYISDTATFDSATATQVLSKANTNIPLAPDGTYSYSNLAVTIPNTKTGDRYLLFVTDAGQQQNESDETNNIRAVPITLTAPDLIVSTASASVTSATWGQALQVDWTVKNQGTVNAGATWSDQLYLSANTTLDGTEKFLGTLPAANTLGVNATYSQTLSVTLPSSSGTGSQYLLVVANANKAQGETDATNNIKTIPINVLAPNLQATTLTAPASGSWGESLAVSWLVTNSGTGAALSNWRDRLYFSTKSTFDNTATQLKEVNFANTLTAGGTYNPSNTVTLPYNVVDGNYYLLLNTDANNDQAETSETDNVKATAIALTSPDLIITGVTAPSSAVLGSAVTVSWNVKNNGAGKAVAGNWYDYVYISTNPTFDNTAISLGYEATGARTPLAAGASYSLSHDFVMPNNLVAGSTYYLLFQTDRDNNQPEANESNNFFAQAITVGAPDLIISNATVPTAASLDGTYSVSWTTKNQGTGSAPSSWSDGVYLSDVDTFDGTAVLLTSSASSVLNANSTYDRTANITIPHTATTGTKYLLFKSDRNNQQGEADETNNVIAKAIVVNAPDLIISDATVPVNGILGSPVTVNWTVKNQGVGEARASWTDSVYLSDIATFDNTAVLLGDRSSSGLAANATYDRTLTFTLPTTTIGNKYVLFVSDRLDSQGEANESNNLLAKQLITTAPDLIVTANTAPSLLTWASSVPITWTVKNQSSTIAAPANWRDGVYFSTVLPVNGVIPNTATLLSDVAVNNATPLGAGASYTDSVTLTIPNLPTGNGYLLFVGDRSNNQPETNEANNILTQAVTVLAPDLQVDSVSVPANGQLGRDLTFNWTVKNTGTGATLKNWTDRFYLAKSATPSNDDILFYSEASSALVAGASYVKSATATLPININLSNGNYFIRVVTDADNSQPETDEANNAKTTAIALTIPVLPDLIATNITIPTSEFSGRRILVTWTDKNQGTGDVSGTWNDQIWLSTDNIAGNADDVSYGSYPVTTAIAAGGSITRTQEITLPITASGDRYVVIKTDVNDAVFEYDKEGNNVSISAQPINVKLSDFPNLVVDSITAPVTAFSGNQTNITWTVKNIGIGATSSPYWYDRIWISKFTTLDKGVDFDLGAFTNPSYLNSGESYTNTATVTLPRSLDGSWNFFVETDTSTGFRFPANGFVFEYTNEADNIKIASPTAITLTPPPDLQVTKIAIAPTTPFSGQKATINWTVVNKGLGRTFPNENQWVDQLFMYKNSDRSGEQYFLGNFTHTGALLANGSATDTYNASLQVDLPIGKYGDYFFSVNTDVSNQVYEGAFENNNGIISGYNINDATYTPNTVLLTPPPDLTVDSVKTAANALTGKPLAITYKVRNVGATTIPIRTPNWQDSFYLSTSPTFIANSAIFIGSVDHTGILGTLSSDNSYTATANLTLPNNLAEGNYYVYANTDASDRIFEEDNVDPAQAQSNIGRSVDRVTVVARRPDLIVSNITIPAVVNAGKVSRISWTVLNQGTGDSNATTWSDRLYASTDSTLNILNAFDLGSFNHNGLVLAGGTYTESIDLTIPFQLVGNYNFFVVADAENKVYEGSAASLAENNNISSTPITVNRILSDLEVTVASAPSTAFSGQPLNVSWTVKNTGLDATNADFWYDEIFISTDATGTANDTLVGRVRHQGVLGVNAEYATTAAVNLPLNLSGTRYLIVRSDIFSGYDSNGFNNRVYEGSETNNSRATAPVVITLSPVPDLVVSAVASVNPTAISAQSFDVNWTVANNGTAATGTKTWTDSIYLSRDQVFDRYTDTFLGSKYFTGNLNVGQTYSQTQAFNLPRGITGAFYLFAITDSNNGSGTTSGDVEERSGEANNITVSTNTLQAIIPPPADLIPVIGSISPTSNNAVPNQSFTVNYSVKNQGGDDALGSWSDALYLSSDQTWDINDTQLGTVSRGNVAAQASYTGSLTTSLPAVLPGNYYVILRTDIRNQVGETNETNNTATSVGQVAIDFDTLTTGGAAVTGNLTKGQSVYYKLQATAGQAIRLHLTSSDPTSANQVFVNYGKLPNRGQFLRTGDNPYDASPDFILPVTETGTYYVMAYGNAVNAVPNNYSLTATEVPFSVFKVESNTIGNTNKATVKVSGARFDPTTTFQLIGSTGNAIADTQVRLKDSTVAYVTFDMDQKATGTYDLQAIQMNGTAVTLAKSVKVEQGKSENTALAIDGPRAVWAGTRYPIAINYGNDTNIDISSPLIIVRSKDAAISAVPKFTLAGQQNKTVQIYGVGADLGINQLRPKESHSVPVYFASGGSDENPGEVNLGYYSASNFDTISSSDWTMLKQSAQPLDISDADWDGYWSAVKPGIGNTWGDYVKLVGQLSQAYSLVNNPIYDVKDLFGRWYADKLASGFRFNPKESISGTLLDQTGKGLSAVQLNLYKVNADGSLIKITTEAETGNRILTDASGNFSISGLDAGNYKIALNPDSNRSFTATAIDQNVSLTDTQYTQARYAEVYYPVTVTEGNNVTGLQVTAYAPPLPPDLPRAYIGGLKQVQIVKDGNGVSQLFWIDNGQLWNAQYVGTQWINAAKIPGAIGIYGKYDVQASSKLLSGNAGILITLSDVTNPELGDNSGEVLYLAGRAKTNGQYEWSNLVNLTQDNLADQQPSLIINNAGKALFVYEKLNAALKDSNGSPLKDTPHLYYNLLDIPTTALDWQSSGGSNASGGYNGKAGGSIGFGGGQTFSPVPILGSIEAKYYVRGSYNTDKDCNTATRSISGTIEGEAGAKASAGGNGFLGLAAPSGLAKPLGGIKIKVKGSLDGTDKWKRKDEDPGYTYDSFKKKFKIEVAYEDTTVLDRLPPTIKAVVGAVEALSASLKYPIALEVGARVKGSYTDQSEWSKGGKEHGFKQIGIALELFSKLKVGKDDEPGYKLSTVELEIGGSGYATLQWVDDKPMTGTVGAGVYAKAKILPFQFNPFGPLNPAFSFYFGGYEASAEWTYQQSFPSGGSSLTAAEAQAKISSPDFLGSLLQDPSNVTSSTFTETFGSVTAPISTTAVVGGNVYGTNTLGTDTATAPFVDGSAVLAKAADGRIISAWVRMQSYVVGGRPIEVSSIMEASFDGTTWSAPTTIAQGARFRDVAVSFDSNGKGIITWAQPNENFTYTQPITNFTEVQNLIGAVEASSNFYYSTQASNGIWSNKSVVADVAGMDGREVLGATADGKTLMAWVNNAGATNRLLTSVWNGTVWSTPVELATGNLGSPSIGQIGGNTVVFWSQSTVGFAATTTYSEQIYSSTLLAGSWSAPEAFNPTILLGTSGSPLLGEDANGLVSDPSQFSFDGFGGLAGFPGDPPPSPPCPKKPFKPGHLKSADPNDIVGPTGFGPEQWITGDKPLEYTIRFENEPRATAPASFVSVVQQLDSTLDWRSFRLKSFQWSDIKIVVPDNQSFFNDRIDLTATLGIFVDVLGFIDVQKGEAKWEFRAIDPSTGDLPTDPTKGFLPPNDINTHNGEGGITYTVYAKSTAQTGDKINAKARIIFDTNEAIDTPPIFNTLDVTTPESSVLPINLASNSNDFLVKWAGADDANGSGINLYNVYVSDNSTSYKLWQVGTTDTQATYKGIAGHTYGFISLALDNAGNGQCAVCLGSASDDVVSDGTTPQQTISLAASGTFSFNVPIFAVSTDGTIISQVVVTRDQGSTGAVSVTVGFSGGNATGGSQPFVPAIDYDNKPIVVNFADGETSKIVSIPINPNRLIQGDESVNLTLLNPTGGAAIDPAKSTALLQIFDSAAQIQFSTNNYQELEDGTAVLPVTVTRTGLKTTAVSATLSFTNGTAIAGVDYTNTPIPISFAANETSKQILIPVVNNPANQGNKTLNLKLTNPSAGTGIGTQDSAVLTILDKDTKLKFNLIAEAGTSQQAIAAFTEAANRWSTLFTNTGTINLKIGYKDLGAATLGTTVAEKTSATYANFYSALNLGKTSADDLSAVSKLLTGNAFSMLINRTSNNPNGSGSLTPYLDNNADANNTTLSLTRANAKALSLVTPTDSGLDATIEFNSNSLFKWDFNPSDGVSSGTYDFLALATHEIGHALGFDSGVGILDNPNNPPVADSLLTYVTPLDLFRFSTASLAQGNGVIDWTASNTDKYFSLDGGTTKIASFSTGLTNGDGSQPEHWKSGLNLGLLAPQISTGQGVQISDLDKRAFDVIGWNLGAAPSTDAVLSFTDSNFRLKEDNTVIKAVTITRSGGLDKTVSATVSFTDGTATGCACPRTSVVNDYENIPITVTFNPNETSKTVDVFIRNDVKIEGDESFSVSLGSPSTGAVIGTQSTATVTIQDDDAPIIANVIADQTTTVGTTFNFKVPDNTYTDGTNPLIVYSATLANGNVLPAWLNFNSTTRTFTGTPPASANIDIKLIASVPSGAAGFATPDVFALAIAPAQSILSFTAADYTVREDGTTTAAITVARTGSLTGVVGATVKLSDGTATAPVKYDNADITLAFADGESSKVVTVPVTNTLYTEPTQTVNLALVNPTGGATLGNQATSTLSIFDNYDHSSVTQNETITAPAGSEYITVTTGSGNNIVDLSNRTGNVNVFGGTGVNTITGGSGNDLLSGGLGSGTIRGGAGADRLYAGVGGGTLYGGLGVDRMYGGAGADIFALEANSGSDIIYNFDATKDRLGLTGSLTFGALSLGQSSSNTIIRASGISLATLIGINPSALNASSFVQL